LSLGSAPPSAGSDEGNTAFFRQLITRCIAQTRRATTFYLWRLHPERWLESLMVKDIATVDQRLQQTAR
jgi:hypothetical protein